jgi:hypothetical protein
MFANPGVGCPNTTIAARTLAKKNKFVFMCPPVHKECESASCNVPNVIAKNINN